MDIKQVLQLFFLILICSTKDINNTPTLDLNVKQAEFAFKKMFCTFCFWEDSPGCRYNMDNLSKLPQAGYFNLSASPISNNPYNITLINVKVIQSTQNYQFPNGRLVKKNHSSLLYLPSGGAAIRGIVIYFHATTLGKWNGPSSNGKEYQAIGGLYASHGYAVIFPDLLGYRSDTDPNPFLLYPEVSVRSAVTTLNELVSHFKGLGVSVNPLLYSVGYGEGGNYAAWFSKCISFPGLCPSYTLKNQPKESISLNPYYQFKGAAVMEGALDLSVTMFNFLTRHVGMSVNQNEYMIVDQSNHNFAKGPLIIPLLDGYLLYSSNKSGQLYNSLAKDFFLMNCNQPIDQYNCNIYGKHYNVTSAIRSNVTQAGLQLSFGLSSFSKKIPGYRQPYLGSKLSQYSAGDTNSILSLASSQIILNSTFLRALQAASIIDYAKIAPSPTYVWTLVYDSVVTGNNTRNFVYSGAENPYISFYQFDNAKHRICDQKLQYNTVDHDTAETLANIFGLNFIQGLQ